MHIKQKYQNTYKNFRQMPLYKRTLIIAGMLVLAICLGVFLQVKTVHFSYANQESCVPQLTALPKYGKLSNVKAGFDYKFKNVIGIGNFHILSLRTCFVAKTAPKPGEKVLSIAPFGGWIGTKTYSLKIPDPPVVRAEVFSRPIATMRPLSIELSNSDKVFGYHLEANDKSVNCPVSNGSMVCDVQSLGLLNDKVYDISISRSFDGQKISTLVDRTVKTTSATKVIKSSVKQNQVIYDKPKEFKIVFDKSITDAEITLAEVAGSKRTKIDATSQLSNNEITLKTKSDLTRDKSYELTVSKVVSEDGSGLNTPYVIKFSMSSGPGIASISAGSISSPLTQTIVLTLDQVPKASQNITDYITASGIPVSISHGGNKIFVSYANAPLCTDLTINIKPGLTSSYGIVQEKPWSFTTRTVCHTASVIGYSKQGRAITAYYFGNGSQVVLYVGSIHGNEYSTKYLMDAWIDELEANAKDIPANRKIVVVPLLNPDGLAKSSRYSANGVDLNRNFPTADWQKNVYSPSNQPIAGGGGSAPLSEPESKVIANLSIQLRPILTMSFHGAAGYAIANQASGSNALAAKYAQMTGYSNMTGVSGAFSYPITGTYDDWLREKYGLKSVLVELSSNTYSEFSRNKSALWAMAKL